MEIGKRIAEYREALGYNVTTFARKAQLDLPHLRRIERGETLPGYKILHNLIHTYDIDPRYLFGYNGRGKKIETIKKETKRASTN